jgi:hypothetical protein
MPHLPCMLSPLPSCRRNSSISRAPPVRVPRCDLQSVVRLMGLQTSAPLGSVRLSPLVCVLRMSEGWSVEHFRCRTSRARFLVACMLRAFGLILP